uniref:Pollen Ole e 1 allergen and extensin family protein n=1 Tax=Cucumis sativus TaxID=3659 RepID=A0A0A0KXM2_CUCSA
MSWLLILLLLNFSFFDLSEARHHRKLPSAVVVGTVFCDTCYQEKFSKTSHFISGATVAVECGNKGPEPSFREEVKTDKRGEFKVNLPVLVSKHVKKIEECYVELVKSSEPYCDVAATAKSSSLQLKSRKQNTHTFSAGFFTFKPLKQPNLCNQKPQNPNTFDDMKEIQLPPPPSYDIPNLPSPIQIPTVPSAPRIYDNLPPLPLLPGLLPLPQLPPLPPLPPLPTLPPLPKFPIFPPKEKDEKNAPNETPNTSEKLDKFPIPPIKPLRKPHHFVLPPQRLHHHPRLPPQSGGGEGGGADT